ncbi:nicotinamidase-like amidase [Halobacteroides halobius DSM 5150]|uniref:Nicotinamidase-like amidase n=1 Tax=Halobacteroides halobius (strain ATCC 35273 / DSM 5150 / MD-1) TaxID=748449 RepID=L0K568_HALHC|nr:isochorismatase family cysteine hydrolase [Halobacteroides halobius]AGB40407.1 nicotinamidase-like amidase [Halobacteroides halobius DSM 5150]
MGNQALMIVDVQNDTKENMPRMQEVIENLTKIVTEVRKEEIPIFYLCDWHTEADPEVKRVGPHCMADTSGAKIVSKVAPTKNDIVIKKREQNGFSNPKLAERLGELNITEVLLTGDLCVYPNAKSLLMNDIKVKVFRDAVASPYGRDKLIRELQVFDIPLLSTNDFLQTSSG